MAIYSIKPWFRNQLRPLIRLLWNVHPDVLTWTALFISISCGFFFYLAPQQPLLALLIIPLLFVRLALNALDGLLAQETGKARAAGEVLNEASDRLADIAILAGMTFSGVGNRLSAFDLPVHFQISIGFTAIIIVMFSSYMGILGKAVGAERIYSGVLGKADRMILIMVTCLLFYFLPNLQGGSFNLFGLTLTLFIPMGIITIAQRTAIILKHLGQEKK